MSVFDDLVKVGENGELIFNQWIEWDHLLIPNKPEWFREILRNIMALFGHCLNCTALDGCYLVTRNMPKQPLHENCDCRKRNISFSIVKKVAHSECDIRKFTEYVFKNTEDSKGKNKIFFDFPLKLLILVYACKRINNVKCDWRTTSSNQSSSIIVCIFVIILIPETNL